MEKNFKYMMTAVLMSFLIAGAVFAADKSGHDMAGHDMAAEGRVGDLIHESVVDGYVLAYHFMDLRDQKTDIHDMSKMDKSHADKKMDKPHHLMVYIMDKDHKPVLSGKVGFVIKDAGGRSQKAMGMFMSRGFGITADMKDRGIYTIIAKAVLGDKQLMDRFEYEIK
jgi:hypothetical protein